jgi:potassium efflux system protein
VIALVAGISLSTPLGNLGSGVLLAFTQPVRLGDRVTVGEHTGVVRAISLSYTTLVTDEGPHVYVPNQRMVSEMLINRSVGEHPA